MNAKISRSHPLERFSTIVARKSGSSVVFLAAAAVIVSWGALGPVFNFSNSWQLFINSTTTIVTFLMVFLIQRSQNKESLAIQLKLNELIASSAKASNRLIDIEDLDEEELELLEKYFDELVAMSRKDKTMHRSHTIEEAEKRHKEKHPSKAKSS